MSIKTRLEQLRQLREATESQVQNHIKNMDTEELMASSLVIQATLIENPCSDFINACVILQLLKADIAIVERDIRTRETAAANN
jgi:hypothetical protein